MVGPLAVLGDDDFWIMSVSSLDPPDAGGRATCSLEALAIANRHWPALVVALEDASAKRAPWVRHTGLKPIRHQNVTLV